MLTQRMAFEVDLAKAVETKTLPNILVKGDANAHEVCVTVKRGGEPVDLTGADVKGFGVVGTTVVLAQGQASGSVASFTLGEGFYQKSGTITLLLTLTRGDVETTVFRAVGQILDSGSGRTVLDPDAVLGWEALQRVAREAEALLASIERAEQAAEDAEAVTAVANEAAQGADTAAHGADVAANNANNAAQSADIAAQSATSAATSANDAASAASQAASAATSAANVIDSMRAEAVSLPPGSNATATWDRGTGLLRFGIPQSNLTYATFEVDGNMDLLMYTPEGFDGIDFRLQDGELEMII